ncbi:MAG: M23 family metallopeptidase [Rikenellaceae bacterium]
MVDIKKITYSIIACSLCTVLGAQNSQYLPANKSLESLPQVVVDTIATDRENVKIVLYSNNTWAYFYQKSDIDLINSHQNIVNHWDTTQLFAYKDIPYSALPSVVELDLISDIKEFHPPTVGKVHSKYGPRRGRNHNGVDISMNTGEPLYATFDGKVRYAQYNSGGYGYMVIIRHTNGLESWYGHLSKLNVTFGDVVKAGKVIGFAGSTGRSTGTHLHYEMRYKDQTFDPEFLIDFEKGLLRYEVFALEKSFFNINSRASEILEDDDNEYTLLNSLLSDAPDSAAFIVANSEAKVKEIREQIALSEAVYHTVRSGDMLGKIAVKYKVSIDQICKLNKITRTTTLKVGRKLRVR